VLEKKLLSKEQLDDILRPEVLTQPRYTYRLPADLFGS
jgi:aspartate ammonia-lyase